jgi:hypothetical protein
VNGGTYTVALDGGKKTVTVVAKASGYSDFDRKITVTGDAQVPVKMHHHSATTNTNTHNTNNTKKPPGGLIDL